MLMLGLLLAQSVGAQSHDPAVPAAVGQGIKALSKSQLISLALSAAPAHVAKHAAVMMPGEEGGLIEIKPGTNGFVCIPDIDGQPIPDPVCLDPAGFQWLSDLMARQPRPSNAVPGVAYMAQGGWHREKDGRILLGGDEPGSTRIQEPPHWMLLWPVESSSGLPSFPNPGGVYIMFDGTPFAHLMIYQDPRALR
ncbi:MAG: hypothetical protein ABIO65_05525 [Nitrospiria bacterium]